MRYITCEIPHDEGYVIPMGDLHFADKAFKKDGYNKLREYISFLKENENARAFLGGDMFNMAGRNTKTSPFEQRMSVNDEMNGIVDMLMPVKDKICGAISGNHECFDSKTEILSEDGWIGYDKITKDTVIYTYNKEKDLVEKEKPKAIQIYDYDGELNRIKNSSVDLLITDNHRILYKKQNHLGRTEIKKLSDIYFGNNRLAFIVSGKINQEEYPIDDDELRILAWLLTDGCLRNKQIIFYQRESKYHKITRILNRLGWKYSIYKRDRDIKSICGKELKKKCEVGVEIRLISPYNHRLVEITNNEKVLPSFIYQISDRQFEVFLNAFIDGDGSRHKSNPKTSLMIYGTKRSVDDMQVACFLHGYRASITEYRDGDYRLNITKNRLSHIDGLKRKLSKEKYSGIIWDVTTPNDTVIVRRNGRVSITGNSRSKNEFDIDLIEVLCSKLGIPYLGYSGVVNYKVKRKKDNEGGQWYENYYIYYHHSTGGGSAMGGALNRTEKLQNIVEGCDMYCSFHSHKLSHAKMIIFKANPRSKKIEERTVDYLTCGGYLSYEDSYAERGMMRPVKVGSPLVKLLSNKHEIKCIL